MSSFGETSCGSVFRKCASKTNINVKQPLKLRSNASEIDYIHHRRTL